MEISCLRFYHVCRCDIPDEVLKLVAPALDSGSFVSLAHSSKQLQSAASAVIGSDGELVRTWLLELISKAKQNDVPSPLQKAIFSISWLLKQAATAWGIVPLAQQLRLQDMLLACGNSTPLAICLIEAGTRISYVFMVAAAFKPAPGAVAWVEAYRILQLSTGLPPTFDYACVPYSLEHRSRSDYDRLQQLSVEQYYHLAAVVLANLDSIRIPADSLIYEARCRVEWGKAQVQTMLQLRIQAEKVNKGTGMPSAGLQALLCLPAAKELSMDEVVELVEFASSDSECSRELVEFLIKRLSKQLTAAVICRLCSHLMRMGREGETVVSLQMLCETAAVAQLRTGQVESLLEQAMCCSSPKPAIELLQLPQAECISQGALERLLDTFASSASWQEEAEGLQLYLGELGTATCVQLLQQLGDGKGAMCPRVLQKAGKGCSSCFVLTSLADSAGAVEELSNEEQHAIVRQGIHHRVFPRFSRAVSQGGGLPEGEVCSSAFYGLLKALESDELEPAARSNLFYHLLDQTQDDDLSVEQVEDLAYAAMRPGRRDELMSIIHLPAFKQICSSVVNELFAMGEKDGDEELAQAVAEAVASDEQKALAAGDDWFMEDYGDDDDEDYGGMGFF